MTKGFVGGPPEDVSPEPSGQALGDSSSDRPRTNSIPYFRLLILTRWGFPLACMSNLSNTGSDVGKLGRHRIQTNGPDTGVNTTPSFSAWMGQFVRANGTHDSDEFDSDSQRTPKTPSRADLDAMSCL